MPLLEVRNVAKRYGPVVALKSADLVVEPGEVHALLGANGAGKSTLVKILTGVIRHDAGTIQVNGKDVRIGSPEGARKVGFAPVFQDPALLPDLTVAQNMRLTRTPIAGVREWLERMELTVDLTEMTSDLPLPTLRMLDLARALARDPQLLMLDEITAALPTRPRREGLHGHARVARPRPLRALHLPPPGRGVRHLRPRQRAARRPHGRHARPARGRGGEDRRADARRDARPSSPSRSRPR